MELLLSFMKNIDNMARIEREIEKRMEAACGRTGGMSRWR